MTIATVDDKYMLEIEKIRETGNKHMKNIVFQTYQLNMLSKRIMEWHLYCKKPSKTLSKENKQKQSIKTSKQLTIQSYKQQVKQLLFKNQLLRDSIFVTKQKDFLSRTLHENNQIYKQETIQNDFKFQIITKALQHKVDKINKYHQKNDKLDKNHILNTLHKQINNIYKQINFSQKSQNTDANTLNIHNLHQEFDHFDDIFKVLLDSAYNGTSNVSALWRQYFFIYLHFGDRKNILPHEWKSKLQILSKASKKHTCTIKAKDFSNILLKSENYSFGEKTFFENRNLFREFGKNKNESYKNHKNKMICNQRISNINDNKLLFYNGDYNEYNDDECCFVNDDELSVYSYQYNNNNNNNNSTVEDIDSDANEIETEIDPIYRKIEWKKNEFIERNVNVPNLRLKNYKKVNRKQKRVKNNNLKNEEKQQNKVYVTNQIKNEAGLDLNARNIPYLGHLPKQNVVQASKTIKTQPNNDIGNKKTQFLQSFFQIHQGNKQHLENQQHSFQNLPQFLNNNNNKMQKCKTCHLTQDKFETRSEFESHERVCNKLSRKKQDFASIPTFNEENKITLEGMTNNLLWKSQHLYWDKSHNSTLQIAKNLHELLNTNNEKCESFEEDNDINGDIDGDRLWNIANITIQADPSETDPLRIDFEKYKQESIESMLNLKVSSNEFAVGFSKPQNIKYSKRKRCIIYKNMKQNVILNKPLKPPADSNRNDINKAPLFQEKQNLTFNDWINCYNNNIVKKQSIHIPQYIPQQHLLQISQLIPKPT